MWYRIYVDKKIDENGEGGEHSRQLDFEAESENEALGQLELEADEEINQIVSLAGDPR